MINGCSDKLSETTFKGKFWEVVKNTKSIRALRDKNSDSDKNSKYTGVWIQI